MTKLIKIAVDAMGGDNSPRKIIDGIIHNHKKNKETFDVHFKGIQNLVRIIGKKKSTILVQLGSSLEYGKEYSPHSEKIVCKPISYYGNAKFLASNFIKRNLKNYIILRPYQIYGPHQKVDRLIPITIASCLKNKSFPCSEGFQLRDFLYVDDFNSLLIKIIKKKKLKVVFTMLVLENLYE